MGFLRQEYSSGLPFPPPGNLSDLEIEPASPASPALAGKFFTTEPAGKPIIFLTEQIIGCTIEGVLELQIEFISVTDSGKFGSVLLVLLIHCLLERVTVFLCLCCVICLVLCPESLAL